MDDSGAKVLFAGTPQLLNNLNELNIQIPIISFCKGMLVIILRLFHGIKFLKTGENENKIIKCSFKLQ